LKITLDALKLWPNRMCVFWKAFQYVQAEPVRLVGHLREPCRQEEPKEILYGFGFSINIYYKNTLNLFTTHLDEGHPDWETILFLHSLVRPSILDWGDIAKHSWMSDIKNDLFKLYFRLFFWCLEMLQNTPRCLIC